MQKAKAAHGTRGGTEGEEPFLPDESDDTLEEE
jgi:hypothetical protein